MALIRNIQAHGPRQAIVRAILGACNSLGIEVIAEGVEAEREYQWLREQGVSLFQGFLLAPPGFESLRIAADGTHSRWSEGASHRRAPQRSLALLKEGRWRRMSHDGAPAALRLRWRPARILQRGPAWDVRSRKLYSSPTMTVVCAVCSRSS